MVSIYIFNYNNYYNRIVKLDDDLANYGEVIHSLNHTNFNPADGVMTSHVIGGINNQYDGAGDYLVVVQNGQIIYRWFIIEAERDRGGQWTLQLRRDVIADYYNIIVNAPCFIEKATLNSEDSFLYQKENMSLNQIKKSEFLLRDKTNCGWIVGYYDRSAESISKLNGSVGFRMNADSIIELDDAQTIESWKYYNLINAFDGEINDMDYCIAYYSSIGRSTDEFDINYKSGEIVYHSRVTWDINQTTIKTIGGVNPQASLPTSYINRAFKQAIERLNRITFTGNYYSGYNELLQDLSYLRSLDGKLVKTGDGKVYKVSLSNEQSTEKVLRRFSPASELGIEIKNVLAEINSTFGMFEIVEPLNENSFRLYASRNKYRLNIEEEPSYEARFDFATVSPQATADAQYNIFCIPYGNIRVLDADGNEIVRTRQTIGKATADAIILAGGGSIVYDVQLLPYCPMLNNIETIVVGDRTETVIKVFNSSEYSLVKQENGDINYGIIFNVPFARFKTILEAPIVLEYGTNIEKKLSNQCDMYRLASPNFSNYFDFSPVKNKGVDRYNVDCTYKPYTPYIHINPVFNSNGLYGQNYGDARGLILGGDFSLTQVTDQWEAYQINNKYYQEIFDRQIQNMEVQQEVQRIQEVAGMAAGVASGAATGALMGSALPGPGTAVGAVVGGAMSLAGGALDMQLNETLRNEALDYSRDMFGYQLRTIQALPMTISKVSSFNNNNKIFPVLEYYTCTEEEKKAFLYKVAYNGMTVMRIGKISDFIANSWEYFIDGETIVSKNYIKGKLIRIADVGEDYHIANAIAGEINKGAYF